MYQKGDFVVYSKSSNVTHPLHTIYPSITINPSIATPGIHSFLVNPTDVLGNSACLKGGLFTSLLSRSLTPSHHLSPSGTSSAWHPGPGSDLSRLGPLWNKAFDSRKEGVSRDERLGFGGPRCILGHPAGQLSFPMACHLNLLRRC